MTIKAQEFDRLALKFELKLREGRDLLAWFEYDGKIITRTRRSKGSGDLPMQHSIRQQLKLNEQQLRDAIGCSLTREGYIEILRGKGLIEPERQTHRES
jgi:hypothetical protein